MFGDETSTQQYEPPPPPPPFPSYTQTHTHNLTRIFPHLPLESQPDAACQSLQLNKQNIPPVLPSEGYLTLLLVRLSTLTLTLLCCGTFSNHHQRKDGHNIKNKKCCCAPPRRKTLYLLSREAGPGVKYFFRHKYALCCFFTLKMSENVFLLAGEDKRKAVRPFLHVSLLLGKF